MLRLNSKRWPRLLAVALCVGVVGTSAVRADDDQPVRKTQVQTRSGGVIRIVGPDGKVQERRFGTFASPDHEELMAKLKELQAAAGDREAVERISKELLESMHKEVQQPDAEFFVGQDLDTPKYGLGVSLAQEIPVSLQRQLKIEDEGGVLVQTVAEESPAAKAGLKEFDIILAVDGKPITLPASLVDAVQAAGENQKAVSLTVVSGGEHKVVEVTPSESRAIAWDLGQGGAAAGGLAGGGGDGFQFDLDDLVEMPPMINFRIPHAMMMRGEAGQPNVIRMFDDTDLHQRIEKLEAELKELNAKLDKLVEKE